jgi:hypothetical protein
MKNCQNVSVALMLSEMLLKKNGVCRVHECGYAGIFFEIESKDFQNLFVYINVTVTDNNHRKNENYIWKMKR